MPEHTIAENLQRLQTAKVAIGNAITAKGGTVGANDGLEDFASDIATIPSGGDYNAEFIGKTSFTLQNSLKEIVIPRAVITINGVFSGFTALEKVDMSSVSGQMAIGNNTFYNCTSLYDVKMPRYITSLGNYVFAGCTRLENIVMSNMLNLGNDTFSGCTSLKSVILQDGLTTIGARDFSGCVSLKSIDIPQTVTTIRVGTFNNLRDIEYIKFLSSTPPTIPNSEVVFLNLPTTCKILVPTGSLTVYTTAANYPDSSTYTYEEY